MTVDISKIRVGDKVTLTQSVVDTLDGDRLRVRHPTGWFEWVGPELITEHYPKPLEIEAGDTVRQIGMGKDLYKVEHVAKGCAWIIGTTYSGIRSLSVIELVEKAK